MRGAILALSRLDYRQSPSYNPCRLRLESPRICPTPLTQIVTQVCAKARGRHAQSDAKSRTFH